MKLFIYIFSVIAPFIVPFSAFAATLSLSPTSGAYTSGNVFSVGVYLNTQGAESLATDLELLYPSDLLEVVDADSNASGIQITPGTLMPQNQLNTAASGRVRFAQIIPVGQKFSNTIPDLFATVQFRVIGNGTAPVIVEFTPGNTRDSNVATLGGIDLLTGVTNASFSLLNANGTLTPSGSSYTFTRNLRAGTKGEDVRQLQKFLNAQGFTIAASGAGSSGNETDYFGNLTKTALIRFQEAYSSEILAPAGLTRGSGYFGPGTRNKIHGLLQLTLPTQASAQAQSQISQLQEQIRQAQEQVNRLMQQLQATQGQ